MGCNFHFDIDTAFNFSILKNFDDVGVIQTLQKFGFLFKILYFWLLHINFWNDLHIMIFTLSAYSWLLAS